MCASEGQEAIPAWAHTKEEPGLQRVDAKLLCHFCQVRYNGFAMDATTIQALASVVAMVLATLTLVGGWMYWLVRDLRTDMRTEMRNLLQDLRKDIRRNHVEIVILLQGHSHEEDGSAVFRKLPGTSDD